MADGDEQDELESVVVPGLTDMPIAGRIIELRSPASQSLNLTGSGTFAGTQELQWAATDREAGEIEIRARIVGALGGFGAVPVVRFSTVIGHGNTAWSEPQATLPIIAGTPILDYTLPARGMVFRVSARQFNIIFQNAGVLAGFPLASISVLVSINPVWGNPIEPYPYSYLADRTAGVIHPFPMTARLWRLTDLAGLPIGAGPGVLFVGVTGAIFGVNPASSYSTFQPIPHDAVGFIASDPMYAHYQ